MVYFWLGQINGINIVVYPCGMVLSYLMNRKCKLNLLKYTLLMKYIERDLAYMRLLGKQKEFQKAILTEILK